MADNKGRKVAVIGAGWAGCSAAVELSRRGCEVTVFEAARSLGGRARMVEINGQILDNGQHILLGAYSASLGMMRKLGLDPDTLCLRLPLQIRYPEGSGVEFVASRIPAPWHLLAALVRAKGLALEDKLALARFTSAMRWMGWQLHNDCSVAEFMSRHSQTERLVDLLWQPLCLAALNTPPEHASASMFLNVLRDSLGARRAASDMLIPRTDLTSLLPAAAGAFLSRQGSQIRCGTRVDAIHRTASGYRLCVRNGVDCEADRKAFDAVILAADPQQALSVLAQSTGLAASDAVQAQLAAFEYETITTCFLQYPPSVRLPHAIMALPALADGELPGQFVFDRSYTHAASKGLLAIVISASSSGNPIGQSELPTRVAKHLASAFALDTLENPLWSRVITEKRATFSCKPNLSRPDNALSGEGLFLAGDYTASEYPATLESAVRSGVHAAGSAWDYLESRGTKS